MIKRQQNGVDRQLLRRNGGRLFPAYHLFAAPEPGEQRSAAAEERRCGIPEHQDSGDQKDEVIPAELEQQQQQQRGGEIVDFLPSRSHFDSTSAWVLFHEFAGETVELSAILFHVFPGVYFYLPYNRNS